MNVKINIENLTKTFNSKKILDNLTLDIHDKDSLVILGQSGIGKSVLLHCIAGLIKPESGKIIANNQNIIRNNIFASKNSTYPSIGMLFQNSALFDSLKIWENITFSMHNDSTEDRKKIAKKMLDLVDISDNIIEFYPSEISGGMQKRISLARTISTNPEIILFDEPTTGLDPITSNIINDLIIKTIKYLNATAIIVTHDINSADKVANKVAFLKDGKIYWHDDIKNLHTTEDQIIQSFITGSYSKI